MKYLNIICLCFLLASVCFGKDREVIVDITQIKTSNILVFPQNKILVPNTMALFDLNESVSISLNNKKLVFKYKNKQYINDSLIILGAPNVSFKAQNNNYNYCGKIILTVGEGNIIFKNSVSVEDYVRTVLITEISSKVSYEAILAQSVAIRTFVLRRMMKKNYHLCDTTHCQTYKGYVSNTIFDNAVRATKGIYVSYKGNPISAMYSTDSGGVTQSWSDVKGDKSFPYLSNVYDPFFIQHREWVYNISYNELSKKLKLSNVLGVYVNEKYNSGRIKEVTVRTKNGNKTYSGENLRSFLGNDKLKSTLFNIKNLDNNVVFTGKGYGHGYGMCQTSAIEMAKKGWSFNKILNYFYPETQFEIYE